MTLTSRSLSGKGVAAPLDDLEVKVIDIELILKLFFMNMLIEYGHSCIKLSFWCARQSPTKIIIGTFKANSPI